MMLVELAKEAGLPDGVVNCIHGQHEGNQKQSLIYLILLF
jgi:acyl-CoA reductase-like NAD-dependent aldehyde dehydrogenase